MSNSNTKKTIQINPELFKMSGGKTRKARDRKEMPIASIITPNNLKNKLLKRIKEHKTRELNDLNEVNKNNSNKETVVNTFKDEFSGAINYLSDISKKQKRDAERAKYQANMNKKTLKQYPSISNSNNVTNISLDLPDELKDGFTVPSNTSAIMINYKTDSDVPYGCLKNGSKPTYRSWNQTIKNYERPELASVSAVRPPTPPKRVVTTSPPPINSTVAPSTPPINSTVAPALTREQRLEQIKTKLKRIQDNELKSIPGAAMVVNNLNTLETMSTATAAAAATATAAASLPDMDEIESSVVNIPEILREKKEREELLIPKQLLKTTTSRKFTLGKSEKYKRVSVLLKDKKTRKNVLDAQKELKKTNIADVRKYLRQHGIIKVGSTAPNDILRKTFEASMLAGEITNTNKETMLHNFINGEIPKDKD